MDISNQHKNIPPSKVAPKKNMDPGQTNFMFSANTFQISIHSTTPSHYDIFYNLDSAFNSMSNQHKNISRSHTTPINSEHSMFQANTFRTPNSPPCDMSFTTQIQYLPRLIKQKYTSSINRSNQHKNL